MRRHRRRRPSFRSSSPKDKSLKNKSPKKKSSFLKYMVILVLVLMGVYLLLKYASSFLSNEPSSTSDVRSTSTPSSTKKPSSSAKNPLSSIFNSNPSSSSSSLTTPAPTTTKPPSSSSSSSLYGTTPLSSFWPRETSSTTTTTPVPSSSSSSNDSSTLQALLNEFEQKSDIGLVCRTGSVWPQIKTFASLQEALQFCKDQPFCAGVNAVGSNTYVCVGYHEWTEQPLVSTVSYRKKSMVLPANAFTQLAGKSCLSVGTGVFSTFSYPSLLAAQMACLSEPLCMGVVQRPDGTWWLAGYLSFLIDLSGAQLYAKTSTYQLASPNDWITSWDTILDSNGTFPTTVVFGGTQSSPNAPVGLPATFSFATPADALRACVANAPECVGCSVSSSNPTEYTFFWKTNATRLQLLANPSYTTYYVPNFTPMLPSLQEVPLVPDNEFFAEIVYTGCYQDQTSYPAFPYKANGGATTYTVDSCAQEAALAGFRRFGIKEWQTASQTGMCLYGDDNFARNSRNGTSSTCTSTDLGRQVSSTSDSIATYENRGAVLANTYWTNRIVLPSKGLCLTTNTVSSLSDGSDASWARMEPCNPNDPNQNMVYNNTNRTIFNAQNGLYLKSNGTACDSRTSWSTAYFSSWTFDGGVEFRTYSNRSACLFLDSNNALALTCNCNSDDSTQFQIY